MCIRYKSIERPIEVSRLQDRRERSVGRVLNAFSHENMTRRAAPRRAERGVRDVAPAVANTRYNKRRTVNAARESDTRVSVP